MSEEQEEPFVPEDPSLYGPEPGESRPERPLRELMGMSWLQFGVVFLVSMLVFAFLGGPFWSAPREGFPLRLFASYLIIPVLVVVVLQHNGVGSIKTALFASASIAALKFALTVMIDVIQGLARPWPP